MPSPPSRPHNQRAFYETYHDRSPEKASTRKYPLRRAVHRDIYEQRAAVGAGWCARARCRLRVKGCCHASWRTCGAHVTGSTTRAPTSSRTRTSSCARAPCDQVVFDVGDAENLPAGQLVRLRGEHHVLEHIPDFRRGNLRAPSRRPPQQPRSSPFRRASTRVRGRSSRRKVLAGRPQSPFAVPRMARVARAWLAGEIGVDETHTPGNRNNSTFNRFPERRARRARGRGIRRVTFEAQSIRLPYVPRRSVSVSCPRSAGGA